MTSSFSLISSPLGRALRRILSPWPRNRGSAPLLLVEQLRPLISRRTRVRNPSAIAFFPLLLVEPACASSIPPIIYRKIEIIDKDR